METMTTACVKLNARAGNKTEAVRLAGQLLVDAHHWAREFEKHGHTVRLMAAKFVAPYRMSGKRGKNDANDAAAICEAVIHWAGRGAARSSVGQWCITSVRRGS